MVVSRPVEIPFYRGIGRQCRHGFRPLAQVIGRTSIFSCVNITSQLQNARVLIFWILVCRNCRGCYLYKKLQHGCKECGKTNSGKTNRSWKQKKVWKQSHSNKNCKTNQSVAKRHFATFPINHVD